MNLNDIDRLEEPPALEIVHWYQRPSLWRGANLPAPALLAAVFALGAAAAVGLVFASRRQVHAELGPRRFQRWGRDAGHKMDRLAKRWR